MILAEIFLCPSNVNVACDELDKVATLGEDAFLSLQRDLLDVCSDLSTVIIQILHLVQQRPPSRAAALRIFRHFISLAEQSGWVRALESK